MPVDLSPEGRYHKAQQRLAELEQQVANAHDQLMKAHDALHEIVEAKGRGGLRIAKRALNLEEEEAA